MFSLISIVMMVAGCIKSSDVLVVTSGLFAMAGAIEMISNKIKK